jgi:hypothetical protein
MDNEEFKRRLTEVAEWTTPKVKFDPTSRRRLKSGDPEAPELEFVQKYGLVHESMPPEIKKIKNAPVDCEDCGQHCRNGRCVEAKLHESSGVAHWRRHCATCNRTQNPWTKEYDLRSGEVGIVWNEYWRSVTVKNKTKLKKFTPVTVVPKAVSDNTKTVVEDEDSVITFYHDFKEKK